MADQKAGGRLSRLATRYRSTEAGVKLQNGFIDLLDSWPGWCAWRPLHRPDNLLSRSRMKALDGINRNYGRDAIGYEPAGRQKSGGCGAPSEAPGIECWHELLWVQKRRPMKRSISGPTLSAPKTLVELSRLSQPLSAVILYYRSFRLCILIHTFLRYFRIAFRQPSCRTMLQKGRWNSPFRSEDFCPD